MPSRNVLLAFVPQRGRGRWLLGFTAAVLAAALRLGETSANAQSEPPHPILSISANNGSSANTVLSTWTEAQYTNNFTPRLAPRNNSYGFVPAVVSGDTGWSWSSSTPNQITSTPSGTVFPATTSYTIQTQAVTVFSGNAVNVPYYFKTGSTSSKSFVFNLIDYNKLNKLKSDLGNLSGAYVNTGLSQSSRDAYARRIAIALLDWARWYPDYTLTGKNSATYINTGPAYVLSQDLQRASDHNGLAHEWSDTELKAFDAIYDSAALANLSVELGFDVRGFIKSNLFYYEGDFFVNRVPIDVAIASNLSGPYDVLPEVARVLNRPDYIAWMDQYLDATVTKKIRRDGVLEEGLGYSIGYLNANATAAQNTRDYFISRPATNDTFVAISNRAIIYNATLKYGQAQWATVALPNGQLPSFGDTPFNNYFSARNNGNSAALPAYGHVSMGAGSSSGTAVQVNQNFPGDNNHMRSDTCAFVLWAFNNELLGNIRYYNGSIGRPFGEQMLAHNTVEIDRVNLTPFPDADTYGNGDLTLYEPGNNGLALTEIDGQRAYSGKASRFQRLMFLNTADLTRPYVVDVFRVAGGTTHDYFLHGSVRWDQKWQCSFPLLTNSNPYPMLEGSETWNSTDDTPYYGFWRNVSSNLAAGNFQITYSDTNRTLGRDLRLWMTADPNVYNVYIGTTPVPARDNTVPTNFFNYLGLKRPSAIVRHRVASGPLQDLFVSVIEPMNGGIGTIASVERLPMNGSSLESCGLKITFTDGRIDTYLVNLKNPAVTGAADGSDTVFTADGLYSLTGRVGVHMDRASDPRVWTVNATDFQYAGRRLTTPDTYYSGWITGEERQETGGSHDAFTTSSPLPAGTALRNKWLSFAHGTLSSGQAGISEMFKVDQVVLSNGQYYICFTNDHCLEITNGTSSYEQVAPLRHFTTSNSFEIALSAFAQQVSPLADIAVAPGGSSGPIGFTFGNLGATAGASLQVLATSSNPALIPDGNLTLGGSGTSRTITVSPLAGQTGSSRITVSVTDGVWTNSRAFTAFVSDFALSASPSSQTVVAGGSTAYSASVIATNGFNGSVTFGLSGLPVNASASFTPPTITGAGSSTLGVVTSGAITPGTYPLTLTATSGNLSSTSAVTLVVNAAVTIPGWADWIGGSSVGGNWSDAANWGGTPLAPNNSLAFNGTARLDSTNDTAAGTSYSNVVFNAGAGAFTLNGNSITLAGNIINNSSSPQTVALGLNFNSSLTFNGANDTLIIAGGLTNTFGAPGSTTLTLAGSGVLKNLLQSSASPGGTNILLLNSSAADWTLVDNDASLPMTVPWVLAVNAGTFNFGDEDSAPVLTLTTPNNTPQDNQVGAVSGGTGTFNMAGGTLTTSARFNTATAANSTGILNQSGGTLNMGSQFQGANGSNAGEVSEVNVSGGTMNIGTAASPTSPFYVASRGTGTLTVSGAGVVSCGKLDISRNAAGNAVSSVGTVNLDGGTLAVTSVTNISANQQTGGSPAAVFNFNGGTLVAKPGAAPMFFQGNRVTPVTPIQTFVKAGGAVVDDGGNAVTIGEPLQHDGALGGDPDGGFTKLNSGTLTLTATNTFTGDTLVTAGTLALVGNGSIANSPMLNIAAGATLDASGRGDGKLTLASGQQLAGNGTVKGNVVLGLGAVLAPGVPLAEGGGTNDLDPIGALTFSNSLTLGGGSTTAMDLNNGPVTNDLVNVAGALTCGGTLALNPGDPLIPGDSFKLFSAASYNGAFTNITPATPGAGLLWDTGKLAVNGTLSVVADLDFSIDASPPSVTNPVSGSSTCTVTITPIHGFAGDVGLGVAGLPAGAGAGFSPNPVVGGLGSSTLTITASNGVTAGDYLLTVVGTNGSLTHSAAVRWNVNDFALAATPATVPVLRGNGASFTINLAASNGFTGNVQLSVGGLPAGADGSFSPTNLDGSGASILTVTTSSHVVPGDYALTVSGSSGSLVHTAAAVLRIEDFAVVAAPATQSLRAGSATNWAVSVSASNGFAGIVALSVDGLPVGAAYSLNPTNVSGPGASTLSVTTTTNAATGNFPLSVIGTTAGQTRTGLVTFVIDPPPTSLVWNSTSNGVWDVGLSANWLNLNGQVADVFRQGDAVLFDDTAGRVTSVTLGAGVVVEPDGITVAASINNFTISGAGRIGGAGGLAKNGSGVLTLGTANDFRGGTAVNDGVLALTGGGTLGSSPKITIAGGATLDVSGRSDGTLTLASGQQLEGGGTVNGSLAVGSGASVVPDAPGGGIGILAVTNVVTLQGATHMELDARHGTNDLVGGAQAIHYGGTLSLTNISGNLVVSNRFKLFDAVTYSGGFATILPASPGNGLVWDTTRLTGDGTLMVAQSPTPPHPRVTGAALAGSVLTWSGTNGVPGGRYYVLTSTNVLMPLANWTVAATNAFDENGNFAATNTLAPGLRCQFYQLQLP